jgi:hypothetical protein
MAGLIRSFVVVVPVPRVTARQKIIDDEIGYDLAQLATSSEVRAEMHSGKNSTQRRLLRGIRKIQERTLGPGQNLRSDAKVEMTALKKKRKTCSPAALITACAPG